MDYKALSCREKSYSDKETGEVRRYFQVYIMDKQGGIGYIYHKEPHKAGENVKLDIVAGNDGRLRLIIAD